MNYILKSLLHWLCFAGTMFFAAGAVIDAGSGDGASDDSAAGAGGEISTGGGDDGVDPSEISDGSDSATDGSAAEQRDSAGDGRTLPKNVQSALKTFKEAHPELAKEIDELRKGYFDSRGHREFFKSPAEARQAKATLELVGGSEGIAKLQSQVAAVEMVDSSFEQGDPQVLDDIASDYPEGFKKLVGPAIDKLQKLDPQTYATVLQPHVFAAMDAAGMGTVLDAIGQAITANDLAKAKDLIGKSLNWYQGQKQMAGQRQKNEVDPREQRLNEREQKLKTDEESRFRGEIGQKTTSHQSAEISKALVPFLKMKPLGADTKADLVEGINAEIRRLLKADGTYQSQVKALLAAKTRDSGKITQYINAAVSEATKKATSAVWKRRGYGSLATTRPNAAAAAGADKNKTAQPNPAASGPLKIAAKPKREDVDWSKTKDILYITNKAYMKNGPYKGKLVTW